ncbi:MAG TPA: 23S rRNA (uracil(1939)-C(5))-methyltransferase RlmD, partial [bacterium]|nr:23S rRNA (uracil(1939)-C(5))-methyltransferase RlmD [bacterium]
ISSSSFFQTNTLGAEVLYRTIREMADLKGHEVVLDLYCGTGSIAIYIADRAREVIGIELIESATRNAEKNAQRNRADNCRFINGDMRTTLDTLQTKADVVILDPPRSGLHEDVIRSVMRLGPDKIVYVSCNPSTQARDLALMQADYTIERIQPVDMFPHTYHIENIVQMRKKV